MANQKITHIEFKNEWANPKGGSIFYHEVTFDNGDRGQIGAKSKLPEKLQVGKMLEYEKTTDEKGNVKIKAIQLPNGVFKGGNQKSPEEQAHTQRMIIAQSSLSAAVQYYQQREGTVEKVKVLALEFYNLVNDMSK